MFNFLKSYIQNKSGSILPIFALSIIPILLAAGGTIDYTSHFKNRALVLNSADAALLAVAEEARELVNKQNYENAEGEIKELILPILQDSLSKFKSFAFEIRGVKYDSSAQKLVLDIMISQNTSFLSIANIDKMETLISTGVSLSRLSKNAISIAYVLDRSGSMDGKKWKDLKKAVKAMRKQFKDIDGGKRYVRAAVVLFNSESLGFSGFKWGMGHVVSEINKHKIIKGGTNSSGAMAEAYNALKTKTENKMHDVRNNSDMRKMIIFLTDGDNNKDEDAVSTRETCELAKDADIEIYSVAFGVKITDTAKTLMKVCASDDDHYFVAEKSDELNEVFKNIGESAASRFYLTQ